MSTSSRRVKINPDTCEKCPHRTDPNGCPCWIGPQAGFLETNVATGEERFIVGCFYQVIPKLMVEVIKASNRPAAAVESIRNEMFERMGEIAREMFKLNAKQLTVNAGAKAISRA